MKKIIVAILSILVGSVGYTIVDKTIENRVSELESKVSYLEEVVEFYHVNYANDKDAYTTKTTAAIRTTFTKIPTTNTVTPTSDDQLTDNVIGPSGNQLLGYRYDAAGGYYYTDDKECWQSNASYNEVYDNMAAFIMMNIDQIRIHFTYEHKDWMIQFWKGQYGNLLIGSEIGVYTAPEGSYKGNVGNVNYYQCADKEDWLQMEMTCYWKENNQGAYKKAFEREYDYYWWATGFVKGQLTKYTTPRSELRVKARITFKSTEMASLFAQGLRESDFILVNGSDELVDDSFYQKDSDVWLLWTTKYHNCFVGYEGGTEITTLNPQETTHFEGTTTYN